MCILFSKRQCLPCYYHVRLNRVAVPSTAVWRSHAEQWPLCWGAVIRRSESRAVERAISPGATVASNHRRALASPRVSVLIRIACRPVEVRRIEAGHEPRAYAKPYPVQYLVDLILHWFHLKRFDCGNFFRHRRLPTSLDQLLFTAALVATFLMCNITPRNFMYRITDQSFIPTHCYI